MVTGLKCSLWNQKVPPCLAEINRTSCRFSPWRAASAPEMGRLSGDEWPRAPPRVLLTHPPACGGSSPSFCWSLSSFSLTVLSCIRLSAAAPWYEEAGRRGTEAFLLQVSSLPVSPSSFSLFSVIIPFVSGSVLLCCPSGPSTDKCTLHTRVDRALTQARTRLHCHGELCGGRCVCFQALALESITQASPVKRETVFLFNHSWLLMHVYIVLTWIESRAGVCVCACLHVCVCVCVRGWMNVPACVLLGADNKNGGVEINSPRSAAERDGSARLSLK